jgi:hypothetical protein
VCSLGMYNSYSIAACTLCVKRDTPGLDITQPIQRVLEMDPLRLRLARLGDLVVVVSGGKLGQGNVTCSFC